jgi:hypothetical protein
LFPRSRASSEAQRAQGNGGARRDRTDDLMLAKHALYQLSYGPSYALRASEGRPSHSPGASRRSFVTSVRKTCPPKPVGRRRMVGPGRLELPTSRLSGVRSNQLSYGPGARAPALAIVSPASGRPKDGDTRWRAAGDKGKEKRRRRRPAPV